MQSLIISEFYCQLISAISIFHVAVYYLKPYLLRFSQSIDSRCNCPLLIKKPLGHLKNTFYCFFILKNNEKKKN